MKTCPKCGRKQEDSVITCDCGYDFTTEDIIKESSTISLPTSSSSKYPALKTISGIYKFLAWIVGFGSCASIVAFITLSTDIIYIVYSVIGGFFLVISLFAISEIIKLFINIEYNTRNKE
ncbi:MAG: hypothetical protein KAW92_07105 [Candidatus Cloacimonetes bacterium]|nr:hypothetical protein [Candidatus Cloacimonadota bacterium]